MKKRILMALGGVTLCCALSFQVMAAGTTSDQAKALAEKYVPLGSVYVRTEDDDGRFEVKYYSANKQEKYEIDISKESQKVISFSSELYNDKGSQTVKFTEKDAEKVVSAEIKDAKILSVKLDQDDMLKEYEVKFQTKKYYAVYHINPQTNIIMKRSIHIGIPLLQAETEGLISYDKALELALVRIPNALVTGIDLDREGDVSIYEVELYKDGYEYELAYDAKTGVLLWNSNHTDDGWFLDNKNKVITPTSSSATDYIGLEKAKKIALEKAPAGAVIKKCSLDDDDGRPIYEGELRSSDWECDFEIDAITGAILEWDSEYDN